MVRAIDVSNWQPRDLSSIIKEHKTKHVVVRVFMEWEKPSNDHTKAQINSARANGCSVGVYVWCYRSADPRETIRSAGALMSQWGISSPLWLDCETYVGTNEDHDLGPDAAWLRIAKKEADKLGIIVGIYSGRWWIESFFTDYAEFTDWLLWLADYNGQPNLDGIEIPTGWNRNKLVAHQYTDVPVDLNVFDRRAL